MSPHTHTRLTTCILKNSTVREHGIWLNVITGKESRFDQIFQFFWNCLCLFIVFFLFFFLAAVKYQLKLERLPFFFTAWIHWIRWSVRYWYLDTVDCYQFQNHTPHSPRHLHVYKAQSSCVVSPRYNASTRTQWAQTKTCSFFSRALLLARSDSTSHSAMSSVLWSVCLSICGRTPLYWIDHPLPTQHSWTEKVTPYL